MLSVPADHLAVWQKSQMIIVEHGKIHVDTVGSKSCLACGGLTERCIFDKVRYQPKASLGGTLQFCA